MVAERYSTTYKSPVLQQTIQNSITLSGIGVHTGQPCQVVLRPAAENSGRFFVSPDGTHLLAHHSKLQGSAYQTILGQDNFQVQTPEHLLAAAMLLHIDNLAIHVDGPEIPILDGSALPWLQVLQTAGIVKQTCLATAATIQTESLENNGSTLSITPSLHLNLEVSIDFPHPAIGFQRKYFHTDALCRELAPAQTFGFLADLPRLHSIGLAKGADLSNTLVYDAHRLSNPNKRRFMHEPLHHKALDIIGDLALLNQRVNAHIIAHKPSHALTHQWLQKYDISLET